MSILGGLHLAIAMAHKPSVTVQVGDDYDELVKDVMLDPTPPETKVAEDKPVVEKESWKERERRLRERSRMSVAFTHHSQYKKVD